MGTICDGAVGFKNFIKNAFSEQGQASSSRIMMFLFSCFSMWVIWRIIWHLVHLHNTEQLTIWLTNLPLLVTSLCGLIVLPYTVNRGAAAVKSMMNDYVATKQGQRNTVSEIGTTVLNVNTEPKR